MGTYRQIFYQIIFGTKNRKPTIANACERELYQYISGKSQSFYDEFKRLLIENGIGFDEKYLL